MAKKSAAKGLQVTKEIPVQMDDAEIAELAGRMGKLYADIVMDNEEFTAKKKEIKAAIEKKEHVYRSMMNSLRSGTRLETRTLYRTVGKETAHYFDENGLEVFSEPLDPAEQQIQMFESGAMDAPAEN